LRRLFGRSDKRLISPKSCCGGCLGLVIGLAAVFLAVFVTSGRYQPKLPPAPMVPTPNALDDFSAAGELYRKNGGEQLLDRRDAPPDMQTKKSVVLANSAALARLRAGFNKQFGIPYDPSLSSTYPYLSDFRPLARLLATEAEVHDSRGRHDEAAMAAIDAIQLASSINNSRNLMHAVVAASVAAIGQTSLEPLVEKLDLAGCDRAVSRLRQVVLRHSAAADVFEGEKRWMLESLANLSEEASVETVLPQYGPSPRDTSVGRRLVGRTIWRLARDRTLKDLEAFYDGMAKAARTPAAQRACPPAPGGFAGMLAPSGVLTLGRLNATELRTKLLLASLAIRQYRLRYGRLPRTLQDTGLDPGAVTDPESGKPIVYRPQSSGYLLYGVGPNGKDDGGVTANERNPPVAGDLGVRRFEYNPNVSFQGRSYRLVPHMLPPLLPHGAPLLRD
jgi:hypothetical protein